MRCLLVDDSKTMRSVQKAALSAIPGLEFYEAADGLEALAVLAGAPEPVSFALVDWNMPKMDGLTLVQKIRETDQRTPLIMATTEAERRHVLEAIRAGVNNYIVKPFTAEALLAKVAETLQKSRAAA